VHTLLKRQLKRHLGLGQNDQIPESLASFVEAVNNAYRQFDEDRELMERSLEPSSRELMQANKDLRALLTDLEKRVRERTADLDAANRWLLDEIAERKVVEARLRESEECLQQAASQIGDDLRKTRHMLDGILEAMPSAVIGLDQAGLVTHWNRSAQAISGVPSNQAVGRPLSEVFPWLLPCLEEARPDLDAGKSYESPRREHILAGEPRVLDVLVYPLRDVSMEGAVVRIDDVTDRSRLEEVMIQTEKMMTVGGLAAGMAHEINNPLGGILQSAQVALRRLSEDSPASTKAAMEAGVDLDAVRAFLDKRDIRGMIQSVRESARHAARIVEHMLEFSRRSDSSREKADLARIVDRALSLSASDYDMEVDYDFKKIEIVREFDPDLPQVPCSATQIEQVLVNLLRNAAQATSGKGQEKPPRIVVRTALERNAARIEVRDNGPGMDEKTRKHVFEPFYTTKPPGHGTGLGLSVSYFIITQNHGGTIAVESRPGDGAAFIIRLPLTKKQRGK